MGVGVQAPSSPLEMVSSPLPVPKLFLQPRPMSWRGAASGSGPTYSLGSAAPWVLPNVWPPAMSATVSSSFIAMRAKVSRMSRAAASALGLPFGPHLRVHVDEAHLNGTKGVREVPVAGVALVSKPLGL